MVYALVYYCLHDETTKLEFVHHSSKMTKECYFEGEFQCVKLYTSVLLHKDVSHPFFCET